MLVLSPESSCDVCAESYALDSCPHSIPCGHTFCASCLTKIAQGLWSPRSQPACPLCRETFTASDIRRIRIDQAPSPGYPHVHPYPNYFPGVPSSSASASSSRAASSFGAAPIDEDALDDAQEEARVKAEARRLEDKISEAAKKKCTFEEVSALQREVEQWLAKQLARRPDREHASLRLSAALLGAILVNGFAYNEAKKTAKGVEVSLKDKLEAAELVKRKLEIELHRQRSQYSQKLLEVQQLKHEVSRLGGTPLPSPPGPAPRPLPLPLGASLMTPPRPMSAQPSASAIARISTPTPSPRSATPGASHVHAHSPHYAGYSHFPKRTSLSASASSIATETSHLPISTAYLSLPTSATATPNPSPERNPQHQRWIPPMATRGRDDSELTTERERERGRRPRPASALGSYAAVHGAMRVSRPSTAAGGRP